MTATWAPSLRRTDFLRAPVLANARPAGFKEWHHFVVHTPGWRLLANLSLENSAPAGAPPRLVPRVTVVEHDQRWTGAIERFDEADLAVSADLSTLSMGRNSVTVGPDSYRVVIDLPERGLRGELLLTATSRPCAVNNLPAGDGRLSWFFVPRLRASGWFRGAGGERVLDGEPAYHDHNWGRFRWGDDFGWEWCSVLPTDPRQPWSFVYSRMTDRRRHRAHHQALLVCRDAEPVALFRDSAIKVRCVGSVGRPPDCTLPPPMRLVLDGEASEVPGRVEITASRGGDTVRLQVRPRSWVRLARPSELHLDRSSVLSEAYADAAVGGEIRGEELDVDGVGVFEVLHA